MAGNFWESSHHGQWILSAQDLSRERATDLETLSEDEYQNIFAFFADFLQVLGEMLKIRQQVVATATLYFRRFYSRNPLRSVDPMLLMPACVTLASKVEEFGIISLKRLLPSIASLIKNKFSYAFPSGYQYPYCSTSEVQECEFYLLEMLDCSLVTYQPYRPLVAYVTDMAADDKQLLSLAWSVVNDSLRTDAGLLFPPFLIAIAALHMACVLLQDRGSGHKDWFASLNVDFEDILDVTKHLLSFYSRARSFDAKKEIRDLLLKVPKPRLQRPPAAPTTSAN